MNEQSQVQEVRRRGFSPSVILLGLAILLGALFDYFFYKKSLGISFPLYAFLFFFAVVLLAGVYRVRVSGLLFTVLAALLFFSVLVAVRASIHLTLLNVGLSIYMLLLAVRVLAGHALRDYTLRDYFWVIFEPFYFPRESRKAISAATEDLGIVKNKETASQVTRGIQMAIPALLLFIFLFSAADLVFRRYLTDLFEFESVVRFGAILVMIIIFLGVFGKMFLSKSDHVSAPRTVLHKFGTIEISILFGSINVLFFLFLLVQFVYFFGGAQNISVEGYTYAEYARKGFYELVAVAVITFLLLWKAEQEVFKHEHGHTKVFKVLSTVLIVQVLIVMISAFKRLMLLEDVYGFTTLRLYSHVFSVWLGVVFLIMLAKILVDRRENIFAVRLLFSALVFAVAVNLWNPEAFIAQKNIERFVDGKELDTFYLARLSDDAAPVIAELQQADVAGAGQAYDDVLKVRTSYGYDPSEPLDRWQSFHFSKERAKKLYE